MSEKVLIYTDASFKNGIGGYSAIICYKGKKEVVLGKIPHYVDNSGAAEFYAVLKALMYVRDRHPLVKKVTFNCDHCGVVDTLKKYIKGLPPSGKKITILIRKYIFQIAKNNKIFIQTNYVEAHQKLQQTCVKKTIKNLKKKHSLHQKINDFKVKKENLLNSLKYEDMKRYGSNKSSILNNLADHHSRRARRKFERAIVLKREFAY